MTDLQTIKSWFRTRCKPTEAQFSETFDSFWHKAEGIGITAIQGLMEMLNSKASVQHAHEMSDVNGLTNAMEGKSNTGHTHQMYDVNGLSAALVCKQDAIEDLDEIREGATLGATALQQHQDISGKADVHHTHSQSDITGLTEAITNATTNKQDKTDNSLQTTAKTIVGAINELFNRIAEALSFAKVRTYTLDFGTAGELFQDVNMLGAITINELQAFNVEHLYVTYGNVSHQEIDLTQPVSLNVANHVNIIWEIVRTTDDGLASLGVRCSINS